MVQAFTQGPAKLEVKKGGKFELFGGNIHGEFIEIVSLLHLCVIYLLLACENWPVYLIFVCVPFVRFLIRRSYSAGEPSGGLVNIILLSLFRLTRRMTTPVLK